MMALRTASVTPRYSRLILTLSGSDPARVCTAVPVSTAQTSVVLAIPAGFVTPEDLLSATEQDYPGIFGPALAAAAAFRGTSGRELTLKADVLLIDVDLNALAFSTGTLVELDDDPYDSGFEDAEVKNFGLSRGTPLWLGAASLRTAMAAWMLTHGSVDRAEHYVTADEAVPALPVTKGKRAAAAASTAAPVEADGASDSKDLDARFARLEALITNSKSRSPPPRGTGTGAASSRDAVPSVFADEAMKCGLTDPQLRRLLAAARTGPVRAESSRAVAKHRAAPVAAVVDPLPPAEADDGSDLEGEEDEEEEDEANPTQLMQQLVMQNSKMIAAITSKSGPDP
jgi:hypothetical protein